MKPRVDAHVHLYEFKPEELESLMNNNIIMVTVAEDYESSLKNIELKDTYPSNVKACIGLHPWKIKEDAEIKRQVDLLWDLAREADCIGEVGLDKKFVPSTFHIQQQVFREILDIALKARLPLNIHAAGAWRETFEIVAAGKIEKALFHWYTGPLDILVKIFEKGYMVSVNAAARIQEKSRRIAALIPFHLLLTESDGPYNYRGMNLSPQLIPELTNLLASIRGVSEDYIIENVYNNLGRYLGFKQG